MSRLNKTPGCDPRLGPRAEMQGLFGDRTQERVFGGWVRNSVDGD